MATRNSTRLVILLILLAMLVLGQRFTFDEGRIVWRPFGQARHSFAHTPCGIPIHMTLDKVDPRFEFDRLTVERALAEAASLWQGSADAELFRQSDHRRAMAISLEYDQRQHSALQRRSLRGGIDSNRLQLRSREATLKQWSQRIEAAQRAQERDNAAFMQRLQAHQAEVAAWNSAGAHVRTEARRQALERESNTIRSMPAQLQRSLDDLNRDIAEYNRRVQDQRQQAEEYRGRVAEYNTFSSEEPVESGRYSYDREQGRRIGVYRAQDYNELVWIFAHELGHSLGLDHVSDQAAVMHELLHDGEGPQRNRARPVDLSPTDRASIASLCGDRLRRR